MNLDSEKGISIEETIMLYVASKETSNCWLPSCKFEYQIKPVMETLMKRKAKLAGVVQKA